MKTKLADYNIVVNNGGWRLYRNVVGENVQRWWGIRGICATSSILVLEDFFLVAFVIGIWNKLSWGLVITYSLYGKVSILWMVVNPPS